jgi:hypothetical protein
VLKDWFAVALRSVKYRAVFGGGYCLRSYIDRYRLFFLFFNYKKKKMRPNRKLFFPFQISFIIVFVL